MLISLYDSPNTIRPQSDKANHRPDFFASNFLRYSSKRMFLVFICNDYRSSKFTNVSPNLRKNRNYSAITMKI